MQFNHSYWNQSYKNSAMPFICVFHYHVGMRLRGIVYSCDSVVGFYLVKNKQRIKFRKICRRSVACSIALKSLLTFLHSETWWWFVPLTRKKQYTGEEYASKKSRLWHICWYHSLSLVYWRTLRRSL